MPTGIFQLDFETYVMLSIEDLGDLPSSSITSYLNCLNIVDQSLV